jgi:ribosome-associated toxin RatA of RatAB toxin-antitoxin module
MPFVHFRTARLGLALAFTSATAGTLAHGQSAPETKVEGAESVRLLQSRQTETYDFDVPGVTVHGGAAMIAVNAPLAAVRSIITDYAHYQDFVPGFSRSRIIAKSAAGTDVYLQAPILHGAATLWAVTRFSPPRADGPGERIDARRNGQANVDDFRATWKIYAIDDSHSVLKLELLMVPIIPLPGALLTPTLKEAASSAVKACRDRAESHPVAGN